MKNLITLPNSFSLSIYDDLFRDFFEFESWREDDKENYIRHYNLAGYDKNDILLEVDDNVLYIKAKNEQLGLLRHCIRLPRIDSEIKASFKNGLLTITLSKPNKKTRQIKIE